MRDIRLARALAAADTHEEPRPRWLASIVLVSLIALLTFAVTAMRAESAWADDDDAVTSSRTDDDDGGDDDDDDDDDDTGDGGTGDGDTGDTGNTGDGDTGDSATGAEGTADTGATGVPADATVEGELRDDRNHDNDEVLGLRIHRASGGGNGGRADASGAGLTSAPAAAEVAAASATDDATRPFTGAELAGFVLAGAGLIGARSYLARRRKA